MKNINCKKSLIILLLVVIIILLIGLLNGNFVYAEENTNIGYSEKIYSDISISDHFDATSVIVILDKSVSGINKQHSLEMFGNLDIISITDLTSVDNSAKEIIDKHNFEQILQLHLNQQSKENVLEAIEKLEKIEGIKYAGPNRLLDIEKEPNDPLYEDSLGGDRSQWGLDKIQAELAWDIETGSSNVRVGVIDTGIGTIIDGQAYHPDLIDNLVEGGDFVNMIDSTTPGLVKSDMSGHGTHVAGIIGGVGNNNIGISGVNWDVSLVPMQVADSNGKINGSACVRAVNYATNTWNTNKRISILSMSIGQDEEWPELEVAIRQYPGLFVCSTGNKTQDNDLIHHYPSFYGSALHTNPLNNMISVGRSDINDERPTVNANANWGSKTISLFAPGQNIISTFPINLSSNWGTGYCMKSGSSMATPMVSGVAALLLSYNQNLTTEEIKTAILDNVDYVPALDGLCVTNGRLNAYKALKATHKTEEIFTDFGYEGSTYSWKGSVEMDYDADNKMEDGMLIVEDYSSLSFEVKTISSENAWLVTNGEIRFELEQSDGQIIQTNICTVTVDLLNNVTFTGNTFSIDTSQLGTGTYFLKMYCTFNRGEWSSETTHSYAFGVNRPITVMDEFGYLSSWYKWKGNVKLSSDHLYLFNNSNSLTLMGDLDLTFSIGTSFAFNAVKEMTGIVTIELQDSSGNIIPINGNNKHTSNIRVGLASNVSISNSSFTINISDFADDTYTLRLDCRMTRGSTTYNNSDTYSFSVRNETCIAQGSMITLADGSQKAVEDLTGDEQLLVWNMLTGQFDTAPILFIDSDEQRFYQVVNLYFSDGTSVKVIGEHAFWNKDLNEYVFLRTDADQYIGDSFIKQTINDNGEMVPSEVLLIDVVVTMEHTTAWSPVTYGHLCYYVNGMLSMPGATEGLINIFEVDPDAMRYDEEAMNQDIATYGLFTYEEFNALIPVPEEIFEAFNGQYLKVSIGKGYTSIEELAQLIERYSQFF